MRPRSRADGRPESHPAPVLQPAHPGAGMGRYERPAAHFVQPQHLGPMPEQRAPQGLGGVCRSKAPRAHTAEGVFAHPPPVRPRFVPGTSTPWNPLQVAELVRSKLHRFWHTSANNREALDLIFGLPLADRAAVAEAYARQTGGADLKTKLLGALSGRSRLMARAYWENASGQLEAHDAIALATSGLGNDEQSVLRILRGLLPEQVRPVSEALLDRYGVTLHALIDKKLSGVARRTALFLLDAPREKGEVSKSAQRAFEIHEAVSGLMTDTQRIFRALEECTGAEVEQLSRSYRQLFGEDLRTRLEKQLSGFFKDPLWRERLSLAFCGIRDDHEAAADYAAVALRIALTGMRASGTQVVGTLSTVVTPDGVPGPSGRDVAARYEQRFGRHLPGEQRQGRSTAPHGNLAQGVLPRGTREQRPLAEGASGHGGGSYSGAALGGMVLGGLAEAALSGLADRASHGRQSGNGAPQGLGGELLGQLAGAFLPHGEGAGEEQDGLGGLLPAAGMAIGGLAAGLIQTGLGSSGLGRAISRRLAPVAQQLSMLALHGGDLGSASATAIRIGHARRGRMMGMRPDASVILEALDRPDLSPRERQAFLAEVKREYAVRYGGDDLDALERDVARDFGRWASARLGIPTAAMSLVQKGFLTTAERLYHATHDTGFLGFSRTASGERILSAVQKLGDLEKIMVLHDYAALVGKPSAVTFGESPLHADLKSSMRSRDYALAEQLLSVFPADQGALLDSIRQRIEADASKAFGAWVREKYGSAEAMASRHARHPEALASLIEAQVLRARRSALTSWIADLFGPEGKDVEASARQLQRDIEVAVQLAQTSNGEVCRTHADRMKASYDALQSTLHGYLQHEDLVAERAAQVATIVGVTTATVLTAGSGSLLALLLVPPLAGAAARVGAKGLVLGKGYEPGEMFGDALKGAAVGAASAGAATVLPMVLGLGHAAAATPVPGLDSGAHGVLPGVGPHPVVTGPSVLHPILKPPPVGHVLVTLG